MRSILPWYYNQIKTSLGNKSWRIISLMNADTKILHKILVLQRKNYTTCPCRICSKYVKLIQSDEKSTTVVMITTCNNNLEVKEDFNLMQSIYENPQPVLIIFNHERLKAFLWDQEHDKNVPYCNLYLTL